MAAAAAARVGLFQSRVGGGGDRPGRRAAARGARGQAKNRLPGDAHRVVQAVFVEHPEQLGRRAREPDQTKRGQHGVPQDQQSLEPEPGAVAHHAPKPEHQQRVHGAVVEAVGPVLGHPLPRPLVVEVLLEVEHVRVVGVLRVHQTDHGDCVAVVVTVVRWWRSSTGEPVWCPDSDETDGRG